MNSGEAVVIAITLSIAILYLAYTYFTRREDNTRKRIISKFEDIKSKNSILQQELEELITTHNAWERTAFTEIDTNFIEYLELLREKLNIEFSDSEYDKIVKMRLEPSAVREWMEKFRYHNDVLIELRKDLYQQQRRLERQEPLSDDVIEFG